MSEHNEHPAAKAGKDVGQKENKAIVDEANEKGYYGTVPDETPNSHYTVAGVLAGKPTPESENKGGRREIPDADKHE